MHTEKKIETRTRSLSGLWDRARSLVSIWVLLHIITGAVIGYVYGVFIELLSLRYLLTVEESYSRLFITVGCFVLYIFIFPVLKRYSSWYWKTARVALFIFLLTAGVHFLRYRPSDHFSYLDKHTEEGGDISRFSDPRRGNVPVDLNHDIRTTLAIPLNNSVSRTFAVPDNSYLYVGLGITLESALLGPLHFSIFGLDVKGAPVKLYSRIFESERSQWFNVFVDLEEWSGRNLDVTIQCTTSAEDLSRLAEKSYYFISSPHIVLRSPAEGKMPNIALVVIDTLRFDEANPDLMPNLHRFAKRGIWFSNAYSTSNWTGPATASILTSLMPCQHRVLSYHSIRLPEDKTSIAELLQKRGYLTVAASANPIIASQTNFHQGFDIFMENPDYTSNFLDSGGRINRRVIEALDSVPTDAPVFLYVHYQDPHNPYTALPPFQWVRPRTLARSLLQFLAWISPAPWSDSLHEEFRNCYQGECRYADAMLGELINYLEGRGFSDDSLILITADHGEAFLEHGSYMHGEDLHPEQVRIPLVMVNTRKRGTIRSYDEVVSLLDIYPTILEAANINVPDSLMGKSLLQTLASPDHSRAVYSEVFHWDQRNDRITAITQQGKRLHLKKRFSDGGEEILLFDITEDEFERDNLAGSDHDLAADYKNRLEDYFSALPPVKSLPRELKKDEEIRRRLKALGYVK